MRVFFALFFLFQAGVADAEVSVIKALIEKQLDSHLSQSYQGIVIFQHQHHLESFRYQHWSDGQVNNELILSTNGPKRELIREADTVRCILPQDGNSVVDSRMMNGLFPKLEPKLLQQSLKFYQWELGQKERIANRQTQQIFVKTKDALRYSHAFWLDIDTGLILKYALISIQGTPLEQVFFASFNLMENSDFDLTHETSFDMVQDQDLAHANLNRDDDQPDLSDMPWDVAELPPGFNLINVRRNKLDDSSDAIQWQLRFSDGLANISLYIEPIHQTDPMIGTFSMGSVNALGSKFEDLQLVAMGAAPAETVKLLAQSLQVK